MTHRAFRNTMYLILGFALGAGLALLVVPL